MLIYRIDKIPDLTFSKYQVFAQSGIEGLLESQTQFIKSLQKIALLGNVTYDEMKQYALSIKSNPFLTSFRESILQALDLAIKVEEDIYDNTNHRINNKTFFE